MDESEETGLRYINPSLVLPLEEPWLPGKRTREETDQGRGDGNAREEGEGNV